MPNPNRPQTAPRPQAQPRPASAPAATQHVLDNSPFNPALIEGFEERFNAALAKDDAARQAASAPAAAKDEPKPKPEPAKEEKVEETPAETVADEPKATTSETEPAKETPKPEEKPAKAPVIPEPKHTKTLDENIVLVRKRAEGAEAKLKQLQAELEAAKAGGPELEKLRKENEELHSRIAMADLAVDPKFQAHYEGQINPAIEEAKQLVGPENAEAIEAVLRMPIGPQRYKMLSEIYGTLEGWQTDRLREINQHVVALEQERKTWLGRAKETRGQLMARQEEQSRAMVAQAVAVLEDQLKRVSDPENGFIGFIPGTDNAKEVEANVSLAKEIFGGNLSVEDRARASIWAAAAPTMLKLLAARDEEIRQLKESVGKLKSVSPTPGGGATQTESGPEPEDEKLPYEERVRRRAAKSGAFEG